MKPKTILSLLLVAVTISAQAQQKKTIELRLQKKPTTESVRTVALLWQKEDNGSEFSKIYPPLKDKPDWEDLEIYQNIFNSPQALYHLYRTGKVTEEFYQHYFNAWGIDTTGYTIEPMLVYMTMVTGKHKNGKRLFVMDENGNRDLSDDKIIHNIDSMPVTPVRIERFTGGGIQTDTLWGKAEKIGTMHLWRSYEKTGTQFMDETGQKRHVEVYPTVDNYGSAVDIHIGKQGARP